MHRTEAAGNSGNLYVDKNLPATAGTTLEASDRNAVQEELCNVIERAGLTLKTKATDADFDQLETAMFDTELTRSAGYVLSDNADASRLVLRPPRTSDGSYQNALESVVTGVRTTTIGPGGIAFTGAGITAANSASSVERWTEYSVSGVPLARYGVTDAIIETGSGASHRTVGMDNTHGIKADGNTGDSQRTLSVKHDRLVFLRGDVGVNANRFFVDIDTSAEPAFTSTTPSETHFQAYYHVAAIDTGMPYPLKVIAAHATWVDGSGNRNSMACSCQVENNSGEARIVAGSLVGFGMPGLAPWSSSTINRLRIEYDPS